MAHLSDALHRPGALIRYSDSGGDGPAGALRGALALGVGLVAGRMTRGLRDADQDGAADVRRTAARRSPQRGLEPQGVQSDVTPHHIDSQVPGHTGADAPRPAGQPGGLPYGTDPVPTIDPVTGRAVDEPFDQTRQGGRA